MGIWKNLRAWCERCHTCETERISIGVSFLDAHSTYSNLRPAEPLKRGRLYKCSQCGRSWILDGEASVLTAVRDKDLDLIHQWSQSEHTLSPELLRELAHIGGVAGYDGQTITIPCSVVDSSGAWRDKAVVVVSKRPPLRWEWPEPEPARWASDILSVSPSLFALPLDVRLASATAPEKSMGFAPVDVADSQGNEYTLANESHFFDHEGVRGEEIRLHTRASKKRRVVSPEVIQPYYFADWFDGCDALLAPSGPTST